MEREMKEEAERIKKENQVNYAQSSKVTVIKIPVHMTSFGITALYTARLEINC
jgi:hypothetical protein